MASNQPEPADASVTEPRVADPPDRQRYEITADGQHAGFAAYRDTGGQRIFYHTVIEDGFTGRGLGSQLVHAALSDTRTSGKRIVPVCPYVARYLKTHHEVDDLLDPATPAALEAARSAMKS
jgi:predicted GNAT family acetyltransferase